MHILWPVSLINSTRPAKAHTVSDSSRKAAMERIYELIFLGNTNLKTSLLYIFRQYCISNCDIRTRLRLLHFVYYFWAMDNEKSSSARRREGMTLYPYIFATFADIYIYIYWVRVMRYHVSGNNSHKCLEAKSDYENRSREITVRGFNAMVLRKNAFF